MPKKDDMEIEEYFDEDEQRDVGIFEKLDRNKGTILMAILLIAMILVISLGVSLRNIVKVAEAEGEIVEMSEGFYKVIVKDVIFLEEGQVRNPVNISAGFCFNDLFRDRCNIGTKVRLSKYRSLFAEWWVQDSIIKSYNQSL